MKISHLRIIAVLIVSCITTISYSQFPGINDSIAKYRKGEIVVVARKGDKVKIEQLRHEFWFGSAITNSLVSGRMSETDNKQFKEKFLLNFNSAVTENALKWLDMERQKGEPNYSIIDGILAWTEENHIPLRGHNLFWGIPQFVQPWVKDLNDTELSRPFRTGQKRSLQNTRVVLPNMTSTMK
jgi:GH35 family endo-1,4-beta-xylanase